MSGIGRKETHHGHGSLEPLERARACGWREGCSHHLRAGRHWQRRPGPDGLPTAEQLAEASNYIGSPEQTDVIVFAGRPWHFAGDKLQKHPEVHDLFPDTTILTLSDGEKAVWWSELEFAITSIDQELHPHHSLTAPAPPPGPAPYPFTFKPMTRTEDEPGALRGEDSRRSLDCPDRWRKRLRVPDQLHEKRTGDRSEHALLTRWGSQSTDRAAAVPESVITAWERVRERGTRS